MNKDEALRCLSISQKHLEAGNYTSARKFCHKSIALFDTAEAHKLLASIDAAEAELSTNDEGSSRSTKASTTATEEHPSASGTKHRRHTTKESKTQASSNGTAGGLGGEKREYTAEQMEVVRRVRSCKVTEYYEILAVKKECDEADIKKAYRKLALALHPDKNGAPGADEAFKLVSKAFQILSDPQKRAIHDQSGSDPEDRSGGMSSRGFSSTSFAGGGPSFDGEISPEELFNMFFGGGNPTFGGFGGGPTVFTFSSGGGFRSFQTTPNGRREQANAANVEPRSFVLQLLPLIILFGFSILSSLPNLFTTPPVPDPRYSFQSTSRYHTEIYTSGRGVKYHINPNEVMNHPVIGPELQRSSLLRV
ncbi:hypothetical protein E1B28_007335 [Marasmius oreades]|uniref:J domain-containing protein n=1 Tax=Marasmius oreades TaxID=181124 RepID=A0A9P7UTB9_9AGAR|nr:uncharacterized protein E1B28_007335 [Marasmius oreades]KAG7093677.1 hypothetical protein E1B28_007335 [Marasmius oreades]